MSDKWMNDIRERMADRTRKAPSGLLGDIRKEMDRRGLVTPVRPSGRARMAGLWSRRIAAAAAVVLIAGAGWMLRQSWQGDKQPVATVNGPVAPSVSPVKESAATAPEPFRAQGERTVSTMKDLTAAGTELISCSLADRVPTDESDHAAPQEATPAPAENREQAQKTVTAPAPEQKSARPEDRRPSDYEHALEGTLAYDRAIKGNAFTAGVHYSGILASSERGQQGVLLAMADPIGYYNRDMSGARAKPYWVAEDHFSSSVRHRQPVRVGISVSYRLTDRWSLRTGVDYSYLSSDFTRSNGAMETKNHQQLHYVGVPVSAGYTLWRGRHAHVYVTGGGEVEKLVKGSSETADKGNVPTVRTTVKEGRPQFSVNAAAGAEYSFLRRISVYAEPGASYHFDNKSGVDNIYKDKKLNFNFNIGLRVELGK